MKHTAELRSLVTPNVAPMIVLAFAIAIGSLCAANSAFAATPHSSPKTCGYAGGPVCLSMPPMIEPWVYSAIAGFSGGPYYSVEEGVSGYITYVTTPPNLFCTATYLSDSTSVEGSEYGMPVTDEVALNFFATVFTNSTPPCSGSGDRTADLAGSRSDLPGDFRTT